MRLMMVLAISLAGCVTVPTGSSHTEEEMMTAAAALTKVSAAVEANLRYGSPSDTLSEAEFLAQSVAHDPRLLTPFTRFQIQTIRKGGHATVLVCTQDGATALLEDAGCTAALDKHRWKDAPKSPCVFTVDSAQQCGP